jgi:hypothetical protein
MRNEAVRLFFAISALILVGMLSTPTGGNQWAKAPPEITTQKVTSAKKKVQNPKAKTKATTKKMADRKVARKIVMNKG